MSATATLRQFGITTANTVPNPEVKALYENYKDVDIFSEAEIEELKKVCSLLGVPYSGLSFEVYESKGEFGVGLPRIYSDGLDAVVNFGGVLHSLKPTGKVLIGRLRQDSGRSFLSVKAAGGFELPLMLVPDATSSKDKKTYSNAIDALDDDDMTWAKAVEFLMPVYGRANRDDLKTGFVIQSADFIPKMNESGKLSGYWTAVVLPNGGDRLKTCFLPEVLPGFLFAKGHEIRYENGVFVHTSNGQQFTIGGRYEKLSNLAVGAYTVVKVEAGTGDYGGYNLTLSDGRIVTGNAKITNWLMSLESLDVISPVSSATMHVAGHTQMKNGKTQVKVFMSMAQPTTGKAVVNEVTQALVVAQENAPVAPPVGISGLAMPMAAEDDDPWALLGK